MLKWSILLGMLLLNFKSYLLKNKIAKELFKGRRSWYRNPKALSRAPCIEVRGFPRIRKGIVSASFPMFSSFHKKLLCPLFNVWPHDRASGWVWVILKDTWCYAKSMCNVLLFHGSRPDAFTDDCWWEMLSDVLSLPFEPCHDAVMSWWHWWCHTTVTWVLRGSRWQ